MKHFLIRPFKDGDIDFAYELDVSEQWNDTRKDIERMFNYEPNGCFVAEIDGEPVGHVFSINYGRLGWIGLLIVKSEYRRRGIGTLLTKKAIDYLLGRKVKTIKLEAEPTLANLYRKLGFFDEYDSLRFRRVSEKTTSMSRHCVSLLKKKEITKLAEFDAEYFGANRIKVLNGLYQDYSQLCFISYERSRIIGYVMCRESETGYNVGPFVCTPENPQVAQRLLMKCVDVIGQNEKIHVGVPAVNRAAVGILYDLGFNQYSMSIRMYLGEKLKNERLDGVFSIGGPMKG